MTEATLHHVCEGAVVLYKRDGSNTECWYARFKNPKTGKWKKFSTKVTDLEKAKQVAQRQFDVRVELIKNNIDIDTKGSHTSLITSLSSSRLISMLARVKRPMRITSVLSTDSKRSLETSISATSPIKTSSSTTKSVLANWVEKPSNQP